MIERREKPADNGCDGVESSRHEAERVLKELASGVSPPDPNLHQLVHAWTSSLRPEDNDDAPSHDGNRHSSHGRAHAEARLALLEARYRTLIEQIPVVTFMASLNDAVQELYVSPQIEQLLGFTQREWLDNPFLWYNQLHSEDRRRWHEEFAATCMTGVDFRSEYRFVAKDGRIVWVHGECQVVRDEHGWPLFLQGVAFDITDIKRAQDTLHSLNQELERRVDERTGELIRVNRALHAEIEERKQLEGRLREETRVAEILNRVGQLLAAELDLEKVVQAVTDEAVRITNAEYGAFFYNVTEPDGQRYLLYALAGAPRAAFSSFPLPRVTQIFAPTFSGSAVVRLDDVTKDPRFGQSPPYHGPPPGHLPVRSYLAVPVISRSGKVHGGLFFGHREVGVFTERDERLMIGIAAQAAIAIDNAQLYGEVQDASRRKDEFLALLGHELRNPLSPIRHGLYCLRATPDDAAANDAIIAIMERQVDHMARLVDDLLDVSRITRGKVELKKQLVNLAAVVEQAAHSAQPMIEARGHQFTVDVPDDIQLEADPTRLEQILANLLNNAAKYTEPGGNINLIAEQHADHVVIRVRDDGIGIPTDLLPKVFDLFAQADQSLDRSQGGLGIGLTLVRRLVEMHGGSVAAHSEGPGTGSEFVVRLPALVGQQAARPRSNTELRQDLPAVRRRIVVVDDNADVLRTLSLLLKAKGQDVATVTSGPQAIEITRQFGPDIALVDIGLPDMDGYDVARAIRQQAGGANIYLVAVTGYGQPEDRRRALEAGFDDHLVKPVSPDALDKLLASPLPDASTSSTTPT